MLDRFEFINRYLADIKLKVARAKSGYTRDPEVVSNIENGGYEFGKLFDDELIDDLREELEPLIEDDDRAHIVEEEGIEVYRRATFEPQEVEGMADILEKSDVVDVVRSYFGSEFEIGYSGLLRYEHIPSSKKVIRSEKGGTRKWHLDDAADRNAVRFLVFLTDQGDDGELQVVSSHRTEKLIDEFGYDNITDNPQKITQNADIQSYKGEKGTSVLFDAVSQLHRGSGPSKDNQRVVMILSFLPKW